MQSISLFENGIHVVFEINDARELKLLHFSALPYDASTLHSMAGKDYFRRRGHVLTSDYKGFH